MPDAPGLELIAQGIDRGRAGTVIETSVEHGRATLIVNPEGVLHALSWLRDTPEQGYRFLSSVHAADYLPATPRFAVHYELLCRERMERLHVKALLADPAGTQMATRHRAAPRSTPASPSTHRRLPGAGGLRLLRDRLPRPSRPAPDPDARGLRRLAAAPRLPDRRRAGAVHAQRDRDPALVRVMADDLLRDEADVTERGYSREGEDPSAPLVDAAEIAQQDLAGPGLEPEQEILTINMGPHHPATHGVLRLIVTLQGERVLDCKPMMGYLHTGIEKSCEDKSYWKVIPFVERMDYLSYFFQMEAFCGCVERLIELEIPDRGQVPAGPPHGAQPDPLAPGLARHLGPRPRRDLDVLVLLPRARHDPRSVRDVGRPADAHPLLPGRRRLRGHPGRLRAEGPRVHAT